MAISTIIPQNRRRKETVILYKHNRTLHLPERITHYGRADKFVE